MEIDGPDGPSAVEIAAGEELVLRLPENATTGYRWSVDPGSLGSALSLLSSSYEPGGPGVGAGGVRTVRLVATGAGTTQLRLSLSRAWETGAPTSTYALGVTVGAP
jgi:inhibitor of cysteine peptidase